MANGDTKDEVPQDKNAAPEGQTEAPAESGGNLITNFFGSLFGTPWRFIKGAVKNTLGNPVGLATKFAVAMGIMKLAPDAVDIIPASKDGKAVGTVLREDAKEGGTGAEAKNAAIIAALVGAVTGGVSEASGDVIDTAMDPNGSTFGKVGAVGGGTVAFATLVAVAMGVAKSQGVTLDFSGKHDDSMDKKPAATPPAPPAPPAKVPG